MALGLLCSAFFMTILDIAILTTALPSVQADLGFRAADLSWVVSAYGIPYGALLLLKGARRAAAPSPAPHRRQDPAARHSGGL